MSRLRAASNRLNALPSCISLSATPYCLHIARICFCFAICRLLASAYRVWKAAPSPCRGPKFAITSSSDSIAGHNAVVASLGSSSGDWGSVPSSIDCTLLSVSGIIELSPVCAVVGLVVVADSFLLALLWSGSRLQKEYFPQAEPSLGLCKLPLRCRIARSVCGTGAGGVVFLHTLLSTSTALVCSARLSRPW